MCNSCEPGTHPLNRVHGVKLCPWILGLAISPSVSTLTLHILTSLHQGKGREGGRKGFSCPGAAFAMSLFYMTEAIWQLHYLFLLFFTPDLASAQDWKTHAQTERLRTSITFVSTRLKSVSWGLNEVNAAKPSLLNIWDLFISAKDSTVDFQMHLLIVDMRIFFKLYQCLYYPKQCPRVTNFTMRALLFAFNFWPLVFWKTCKVFPLLQIKCSPPCWY